MNRIQLIRDSEPFSHPAPNPAAATHAAAERHLRREHLLFTPLHYEPKYAYPLLVWLHGPGGDERELARVMPHVSLRNYAAVGPRGTEPLAGDGSNRLGYTWRQEESHTAKAFARVMDCLDAAAERYNYSPSRVFLAGYEAGGTMALRLALANPHLFAGAVNIGGTWPEGDRPLARLEAARKLPLLLIHGRDAEGFSIDHCCQVVRLLHAGGMKADIRQYPCGDEITTAMLHDVDVWLMERVTGAVHDTEPQSPVWETN